MKSKHVCFSLLFFLVGLLVGLAFAHRARKEAAENYFAKPWLYVRTISALELTRGNGISPEEKLNGLMRLWREQLEAGLIEGIAKYPKSPDLVNIVLIYEDEAERHGWKLPEEISRYINNRRIN